MRAEAVSKPHAYHGEGACWASNWGNNHAALRYVDMLAGDVLELLPSGGVERFHVGNVAALVRPRRGGGAVVAAERDFVLTDQANFASIERTPELWGPEHQPRTRFNEGGVAPDGLLFMGTMAYDQTTGAATMFRLTPDRGSTKVFGGVTISNGLAWSPDGALAYYNDTPTGMIQVFDYSPTEGLTGQRPFARIEEGAGHPDGLTVDAEGGVWTALFGGSAVRRFDANGALSEVVEVGPTQVTSVAFGGPALTDLYITTSRENLPEDAEPEAGSLFLCQPGIAGLPVQAFAG